MADYGFDQKQLSEEEREDVRLVKIFTTNLPLAQTPSQNDRAQIVRYLESQPSLTNFSKIGLERFLANVGVMPDQRVICTLTQPLNEHRPLLPMVWARGFGACLRLVIMTPKRTTLQAVFIPGEKAFGALQSNRIVFVSYRVGRIQAVKEFDLSLSAEAKSAFEALITRCASVHADIVCSDTCVISTDLIRADSLASKFSSDHWTRTEWLQNGWIVACRTRYPYVISLIKERQADLSYVAKMAELQTDYDLLHATFSILSDHDLSTSAKIHGVIAKYKSRPMADLLVEGLAFERDQLLDSGASQAFKRAMAVAFEIWQLLELDPELSDWGKRQFTWDLFGKKLASVELDSQNFPIEQDKEASDYWVQKCPSIIANRDQLLSAFDFPLDGLSFIDGMARWQIDDLNEPETKETITQLLNEAVALREWVIPPNAFVEVSVGPFVGVEVTEIADDVFFIWRATDGRFWAMSIGVDEQIFDNTEIITRDPNNPVNQKATLAIQLLMSAIIRDFWVVTERQKIFGIRVPRTKESRPKHHQVRFVYLPRVRYLESKIDLSRLNLGLSYKQRSQHYVRSHFRKANPSQLQLEIAKRARKIVPEGHTYVQGHYRGVEGPEGQTVYRSRSAMALLFGTSQADLGPVELSTTDWFGFERAVSVLLEKKFNFTIVHRATRGKTDYGIDILATKSIGKQIETWVVQCKCYKPSNLVNPSHMRELVGSIADLQRDGVEVVRGMMITTSRISGDALSLAMKHGIQCVAGDDLNLILDSVNKAVDSTTQ
jgi:hypothetical protein